MRRALLLTLILSAAVSSSLSSLHAQQTGNNQMGETVLSIQQAPADAPKKRGPAHPWVELSNLKKGNDGPFPTLEVDYKVTAGSAGDFTLVIKSERGRSTVHVILFGDKEDRISVRNFAFQGFPDNCEVWAEIGGGFGPFDRAAGYKISKSVTMGNVGQLTFARDWRPEEQAAYDLNQKMQAPPPPPPAGSVVVDNNTTPLLPGMPVLGTWMAEWHEGELLAVSPNLLTIKWTKTVDKRPAISSMARARVSVAMATLDKGRAAPATFKPSVQVLEGGTIPLDPDLVPLTADIKVVPGTPLKAEWAGKFDTVTVTGKPRGTEIPVTWDSRKGWNENRKIGMLAIEKETIDRLKEQDATEHFAARLEELDHAEPARPKTPAKDYAISLAIPRNSGRLKDKIPVPEGTKLKAVWGNQWYTLRVLSDSDEGPVECNWENFGNGNWNEWINRNSLVITKDEETKLRNRAQADRAKEKEDAEEKPAAPAKTTAAARTTPAAKPAPPAAPTGGKYEVVLEEMPASKKISIAKVVMKIAGLELKDALQLTDALPISLKGELSEAEAKGFQKQIEAAGGKASVKSE